MQILPFDEANHLHLVQEILNQHLEAVVPGWGLSANAILRAGNTDLHQSVIGPWVIDRKTLCAVEQGRLVAVAHLLRYGSGEAVGEWYQNVGDVGWFVAWPDERDGAAALLTAAREQMVQWGVKSVFAWDSTLPLPLLGGVPDCWPHIREMLAQAGFEPMHRRQEALFGGWLSQVVEHNQSPVPGVTLNRTMLSPFGVAFAAYQGSTLIGGCEVKADLTDGGDIPLLRGWAELSEMHVDEHWRNQGIGSWLVAHAVEWLRMAGCDRIALSVMAEDEVRGAGRFYERFGWRALSRLDVGWGYTLFTPE
jgi:GNAT superfamily N-acetyltransferase